MQVLPERAVGENKRQGVGWCVAAAALMVAFCAAAPAMMQTLAAIADSGAEGQESLRLLGRVLAGVVLVWALVVGAGWRSDIRRLKRLSRAGPLVAGAGLVFWWLPIPFGPTRLLTVALVLGLGVGYGLCASGVCVSIVRGRPERGGWGALAAAVGMVACISAGALLVKINAVAWAGAID